MGLLPFGELKAVVVQVVQSDYTEEVLERFIQHVLSVALSYLRKHGLQSPLQLEDRNKEWQDLALDIVAPLFMRNPAGEFVLFQRYFQRLGPPLEEMEEELVDSSLRRLVIQKTKQELSRMLRDYDTQTAKVRRNILLSIKNSPRVGMHEVQRAKFVFLLPSGEEDQTNGSNLPVMPYEVLRQQALSGIGPNDNSLKAVLNLLELVRAHPDYRDEVPLGDLIRAVRECFLRARGPLPPPPAPGQYQGLVSEEIERAKNEVLETISRKLRSSYLKKGKMTPAMEEAYYKAIREILDDWVEAGQARPFYQYLATYYRELSETEYRRKERKKFEYIVKTAQTHFRQKLEKVL